MKEKRLPYDDLMILLGVISVFTCLIKAFPTSVSIPIFLFLAIALFALIQWIVMKRNSKLLLGFFLLFFVMMIVMRSQLIMGFQYLYNSMVEVYANSDHYVFNTYDLLGAENNVLLYSTCCVLAVFVCYTLVVTITIRNHSWYFLDFILSLSLFIPTIMYRVPQSFLLDGLLFGFWILLLISGVLAKQAALLYMGVRTMQRMVIVIFVITYGFLGIFPQFLYQESTWVEDTRLKLQILYRDIVHQAMPQSKGEVDLRTAQDRYYIGTEEMEVSASQVKEYYIKTFSAALYKDQKWQLLDEEVYENTQISWQDVFLWYDATHRENPNAPDPVERLDIQDKRGQKNYALLPYDMAEIPSGVDVTYDAYATSDTKEYHYRLWDGETMAHRGYRDGSQQEYRRFVNNRYLDVPNEIIDLFDELQFANRDVPYALSDATLLIRKYLSDQTSYTLKPGATPDDQDFVTYFLTENKKGYCVHYASSAVLMFRYLGIPARYTEGYHVSENSFDQNGVAKVLDKQAHAWVEVLDEDRGWIPIEVTPAASQSANTTQQSNEPNDPNRAENGGDTNTNGGEDPQNTQDPNIDTNQEEQTTMINIQWNLVLPIAGVLAAAIAILAIHKHRYQKWLRRMKQKDRKQALIQCEAYLQQWSLYGVTLLKEDHQIMEKAMYSHHTMGEEEYQQVYQHLMQKVSACYQKLSLRKKVYVIFWKAIK